MPRLLFFLCCITMCAGISVAQPVYRCSIPFAKTNAGVIKVPVTIDTLNEQFIFDPGASVISFGRPFFDRLAAVNAMAATDFLYRTKTMQANGQLADVSVYNIKFLAMGSMAFANLEAMVIEGNNAPMLLGQNLVKKFDTYTINNANSTIEIAIRPDSMLALQTLRIVPCDSSLGTEAGTIKKKLTGAGGITIKNAEIETVFPINPNALKRILKKVTIRFFSRNDLFFATEMKRMVTGAGYAVQDIVVEDMTPFFKSSIPGYVEIWIRQ